jgi:hypothetical protein
VPLDSVNLDLPFARRHRRRRPPRAALRSSTGSTGPSYTAASWTAGTHGTVDVVNGRRHGVGHGEGDRHLLPGLKTGAGQGVVDIIANGVVVRQRRRPVDHLDRPMAVRRAEHAAWRQPCRAPGRVRLRRPLQGWGYNHAPCEFIPVDSPRVTASGMGAASNVQAYYAMKSLQTAVSGTLSFDFIGTGFMIEGVPGRHHRCTTDVFTSITVDGVGDPRRPVARRRQPGRQLLRLSRHVRARLWQAHRRHHVQGRRALHRWVLRVR